MHQRLRIDVAPPIKTARRYEFRCVVGDPSWSPRDVARRLTGAVLRRAWPSVRTIRFGFDAVNHEIRHHELWDSVYPLMFLTRNGGPLFNTGHPRATIRLRYPIAEKVRAFYVRRARDFGIEIEVEADTTDRRFDCATEGHVLAFGGGKDSRLLLGLLREAGYEPRPVTAGPRNAPDLDDVLCVEPLHGALADRVMPALMSGGRHFYFGSGLGEVHRRIPWQQYYDWASPAALAEFSTLLRSLGVEMDAHAPAAVLPYNLIQRMLCERYPRLYAHQRSVERNEATEKNLHVSLCELHHGIAFDHHCDAALFRSLLRRFVDQQLGNPRPFGYREHRETIHREMRAIVFRHRAEAPFAEVRDRIPPDWDGAWIDYVHDYVAPATAAAWRWVYADYAPSVGAESAGVSLWRVAV